MSSETPLFVIDLSRVRENVRRIREASGAKIVAYAIKANYHPDILRTVREEGCFGEAMSLAEYQYLRQNGFEPEEIIWNGHKGRELAEIAREEIGRIFTITAYHLDEVRAIAALARSIGTAVNLGVRIDPLLEETPVPGVNESLFGRGIGLGIPEEWLLDRAGRQPGLRTLLDEGHTRFRRRLILGMTGTAISSPEHYTRLYRQLEAYRALLEFDLVDLGGGYAGEGRLAEQKKGIHTLLQGVCGREPLVIEPGRYIVEDACRVECRPKLVSHHPERLSGYDGLIVLSTGMNLLVPLRSSSFRVELRDDSPHPARFRYLVKGSTGASADTLGALNTGRLVEERDTLLILNAGAYTLNLASAFGYPGAESYQIQVTNSGG